ncbi:YfaZ family outer membrane protein [Sulfurimonas sp.]
MLKKLSVLTLSAVSAFALHTGEININDTDLELGMKFDMGQFYRTIEPNTTFLGAKFINADKSHSDNTQTPLDPFYEVNFLMMRPVGKRGMSLGMGVKGNYTTNGIKDFFTMPLGVEFAYKIPARTLIPMYLNGALYYAPQALAFSDAKDFLEYRINFDIEVIDNGRITLGYRNIDTNYNVPNGSFNFNSSFYAGFKIGF